MSAVKWLHDFRVPTLNFVLPQAFAIFCGLGIHNALMYEQACKLLAKQSVAMEVYQRTVFCFAVKSYQNVFLSIELS